MFPIWEENVEAVKLFLRMQSQWKVGAMGGFLGFHYESLDFLFKLYKEDLTSEQRQKLFEDLQVMEQAATLALNKKGVKK